MLAYLFVVTAFRSDYVICVFVRVYKSIVVVLKAINTVTAFFITTSAPLFCPVGHYCIYCGKREIASGTVITLKYDLDQFVL